VDISPPHFNPRTAPKRFGSGIEKHHPVLIIDDHNILRAQGFDTHVVFITIRPVEPLDHLLFAELRVTLHLSAIVFVILKRDVYVSNPSFPQGETGQVIAVDKRVIPIEKKMRDLTTI
jgi:hypothetical protein